MVGKEEIRHSPNPWFTCYSISLLHQGFFYCSKAEAWNLVTDMNIKSICSPQKTCTPHNTSVRSLVSLTETSTVELHWSLPMSFAVKLPHTLYGTQRKCIDCIIVGECGKVVLDYTTRRCSNCKPVGAPSYVSIIKFDILNIWTIYWLIELKVLFWHF